MALVPELGSAEADPDGDLASLTALADWCVRFSPAVAIDPPDGLFLDITGVAHLWGGELTMLDDLIARLARDGVPARGAVAGSAGAAWALARYGVGRTIAESGAEAELLAPLPIGALRLEPQSAAQLARLGLSRVGLLAALPRDQLARRFGAEVLTRLDQALVQAEEALAFRRPPTPWFARLAFAEPISAPEDLARVTRDIAGVLSRGLEAEGRGAQRFELAFHRLDGRAERLAIGLSLAGRGPEAIARLFAPMLETVDPGFGIEVVTLSAERVEPLPERQPGLDAIGEIAPEDGVAPLVDRLANRLGEDRVWRAAPFPSHIPERAVVRQPPFAPDRTQGGRRTGRDRSDCWRVPSRSRPPPRSPTIRRSSSAGAGACGACARPRGLSGWPRSGGAVRRARPGPRTFAITTASRTKPAPATGSSAPASMAATILRNGGCMDWGKSMASRPLRHAPRDTSPALRVRSATPFLTRKAGEGDHAKHGGGGQGEEVYP